MNFFPVQREALKHFTPRIIVHKENLDHNKHLEFALKECTQALDKPNENNNNKPRTLNCLFLHPNAANSSTKQKRNASSSTESELNSVDDHVPKVTWAKKFLEV